jgi:hypothetical protein
LIPKIVFQEVEEAVDLLAASGTPESVADLSLAICATPAIEVFDRVLDDASSLARAREEVSFGDSLINRRHLPESA